MLVAHASAREPGRRLTRRAFLGAVSGAAAVGLAACGGSEPRLMTPTPVTVFSSPVARIAGYEDPARWAGRTLRVGSWGGEIGAALRERVLLPFGTATGCAVQGLGAGYDDLATSIAAGSPYLDVLIGDAFWADRALANGQAQALPDGLIPTDRFGSIGPVAGAVPAYAYALVPAFRREAVKEKRRPASWRDWADGATYPGARALPAQPFGSLEIARLADDVDRAQLYPVDVDRAVEGLSRLAPSVGDRWWTSGEQPVVWLTQGRADFAAAWHYRVVNAQLDGRPVDFIWDEALLIADYWVIPAGSANADVAADFVRFATAPEIQASLATAVPLGPVVPAAFANIDPKQARRLPTAPDHVDALIRVDTAWWANNRANLTERFQAWLAGVDTNGS